ncbi:MAG: BON domain-containing protein [Candidatus Korobacteraceae bacterium]
MLNKTSSAPRVWLAPLAAIFIGIFMLVGCNKQAQHPDVKDAVNSAMTQNGLGVVNVSQDRDKGVITLSGDVETPDKKAEAESLARQAAPGYAVADEIGIRPIGQESQAKSVDNSLDNAIEDNFKAELKAHKNLDDQSVHYSATNGTLVLKGSVKTAAQRAEANKLAKSVPNVKEVVNELKVEPDKHSTTASAD